MPKTRKPETTTPRERETARAEFRGSTENGPPGGGNRTGRGPGSLLLSSKSDSGRGVRGGGVWRHLGAFFGRGPPQSVSAVDEQWGFSRKEQPSCHVEARPVTLWRALRTAAGSSLAVAAWRRSRSPPSLHLQVSGWRSRGRVCATGGPVPTIERVLGCI